jgi:hypothetical protein
MSPVKFRVTTIDEDFDEIAELIDSQKPQGKTVVIETVPPKKQQIAADVVVNIQSTIPDTTELAFDISGLSCSVLRNNTSSSGKVGRAVTLVR